MSEPAPVEAVPLRLRFAAALVTVQVLAELVAVSTRRDLTPGLRVSLMVILGLQLLFAAGITHRSAGSVLGLFTFNGMAVIAAIGSDAHLLLRAALAVSAVGVIVLLSMSLDSFPAPAPPPVHRGKQ
jgi:hypothetical protein